MPFRRFALLAPALLAVVLSACQVDVRYTTVLDGSGGGRFSVAMTFDRDARRAAEDLGHGLGSIEQLFTALDDRGWDVTRAEPGGGLSYEASKPFADEEAFGRVLDELRDLPVGGDEGVNGALFRQDIATERSFFKTRSTFRGRFATSTDDERLAALLRAIEPSLRIEVRAHLPGAVVVRDEAGTVENGVAVWRPSLGSDLTLVAESSALRVGSILLVVLPGLALLGAASWLLVGRRRAPLETIAIRREDEPSEGAAEPAAPADEPGEVDALLALERDPVEP